MNKFPEIFCFVLIFIGLVVSIVGGYVTYVGSHIEIQKSCIGEDCNQQSIQIYPYWTILFPVIGGVLVGLLGIAILCIIDEMGGCS